MSLCVTSTRAEPAVDHGEAQEGPVGARRAVAHRLNVAVRAMLHRVDLDAGLVQWIEAETDATVVDVRRTFGGGSRVTWFVDVERAGVVSALVLRQESGAGAFSGSVLSLAREGAVYRALRDTAVRAASAPCRDRRRAGPADRTRAGHRRPLATHRRRACLRAVRLHGRARRVARGRRRPVGARRLRPAGRRRRPCSPRPRPVDCACSTRSERPPDPEIVYALAWLRRHPPAGVVRTVLVQGDTGPGNFVADGGRVSGLVDWEFAHLGDPMDDLAWVEYRLARTPGAPAFDALVAHYESRTGVTVDRAAVAYYAVVVQVRCAITTARTIAGGRRRGRARRVPGRAPAVPARDRGRSRVAAGVALVPGTPVRPRRRRPNAPCTTGPSRIWRPPSSPRWMIPRSSSGLAARRRCSGTSAPSMASASRSPTRSGRTSGSCSAPETTTPTANACVGSPTPPARVATTTCSPTSRAGRHARWHCGPSADRAQARAGSARLAGWDGVSGRERRDVSAEPGDDEALDHLAHRVARELVDEQEPLRAPCSAPASGSSARAARRR